MKQATLSRRTATLERAAGAKLVVRPTHGSERTPAGGDLLRALERVEAETLASQARLGRGEVAVEVVVRVRAPDGFGTAFLAPRLVRPLERHPGLRVQLAPTPRGFSLSRREANPAVMVGPQPRGGWSHASSPTARSGFTPRGPNSRGGRPAPTRRSSRATGWSAM